MADYLTKGDKIVYCRHGHQNIIPSQQTYYTCSICGCIFVVKFFGVVTDKDGNFVY